MAALATHDAQLVFRHGAELVIGELRMTQGTREPTGTGAALVGDDVDKRVPVPAPPFRVDGSLNLCHERVKPHTICSCTRGSWGSFPCSTGTDSTLATSAPGTAVSCEVSFGVTVLSTGE